MRRARGRALRLVQFAHTVVWAFFVACIAGIYWFACNDRLPAAALCAGIVTVAVVVLAANAWRCPLTSVAARFTADRRANFDIWLPEWLARHNQAIFGVLYVAGVALLLVRWMLA